VGARRIALRLVLAVLLTVLLAACGQGGGGPDRPQPPRDGRAGVQLSGQFAGSQIAASDGSPDLLIGNCVHRVGLPADLCFAVRAIDGTPVVIGFLNPDVLEAGTVVEASRGDCRSPEQCAAVTDTAIVDVQVGDRRQRATSGTVTVERVDPGRRYVGLFNLAFRDGRVTGTFDVVPRPDP
jgi:hypothetical protein